ncbi:MAG: holo-ACP synthase, partial [Gammaproteobacteria bacterium]
MIYGVGIDLVTVRRMQENIDRYGSRFAGKILHPDEMQEFRTAARPAGFLARRFAAKEALAKALGTGFSNG